MILGEYTDFLLTSNNINIVSLDSLDEESMHSMYSSENIKKLELQNPFISIGYESTFDFVYSRHSTEYLLKIGQKILYENMRKKSAIKYYTSTPYIENIGTIHTSSSGHTVVSYKPHSFSVAEKKINRIIYPKTSPSISSGIRSI